MEFCRSNGDTLLLQTIILPSDRCRFLTATGNNMANYWLLIPWIERLCRWLIAGVMILAAVPKLSDPASFAEIIGAYGLLPEILLFPAALLLPLIELTSAFLLIQGRRLGLWIAAILMLLFIAVLSYGIWLGLDIDCGCFGPGDKEGTAFSNLRTALVRDLLLCIPILYCFGQKYILPPKPIGEKQ